TRQHIRGYTDQGFGGRRQGIHKRVVQVYRSILSGSYRTENTLFNDNLCLRGLYDQTWLADRYGCACGIKTATRAECEMFEVQGFQTAGDAEWRPQKDNTLEHQLRTASTRDGKIPNKVDRRTSPSICGNHQVSPSRKCEVESLTENVVTAN